MALRRTFIVFLLLFQGLMAFSQQKYTLSGTITDASSGEDLIGAAVSIQNHNFTAISNSYGFYSISIPEGDYTIYINEMGYAKQEISVKLHASSNSP